MSTAASPAAAQLMSSPVTSGLALAELADGMKVPPASKDVHVEPPSVLTSTKMGMNG